MSAKKTADAALAVAEEALYKVNTFHRSNPFLMLTIIFLLGYLLYINYYVVHNPERSKYIIDMYHNTNVRVALIAMIVLGMSGVFGSSLSHLSTIVAFAYVTTYVVLRDFREGMEDGPSIDPNSQEMNKLATKLAKVANQLYDGKAKLAIIPNDTDDTKEETKEEMDNFPKGRDGPRCTPCAGGSRKAFNPKPYTPDSPLMGIGNDKLPPMGVDFLSAPSGVYTQSQIGYQFGFS